MQHPTVSDEEKRDEDDRQSSTQANRTNHVYGAGLDDILEQTLKAKAEIQQQLKNVSDSMEDSAMKFDELRSEFGGVLEFNITSYLDNFSKAMSYEIRALLEHVRTLDEQKRSLLFEIEWTTSTGEKSAHRRPSLELEQTANPSSMPNSTSALPQPRNRTRWNVWRPKWLRKVKSNWNLLPSRLINPVESSKPHSREVRTTVTEVRSLLGQRRTLQFELGELLRMLAQYGPGGQFEPEWMPPTEGPLKPSFDNPSTPRAAIPTLNESLWKDMDVQWDMESWREDSEELASISEKPLTTAILMSETPEMASQAIGQSNPPPTPTPPAFHMPQLTYPRIRPEDVRKKP
ncbi:hypothetical protein BD410DRAFT_192925 [Rickenella mellea]|uniref:Uncharacterized protein n=1 Tax=Rickenella mellea TaxID=50990 RepID=A0A4Y7PJ87_9AGAM|nr:hypothetical protein BD410DRAFT_192925 [Rickenella mellea]